MIIIFLQLDNRKLNFIIVVIIIFLKRHNATLLFERSKIQRVNQFKKILKI